MLNFALYTLVGIIGIVFGFCLRMVYSMAGSLIACAIILAIAAILCVIGFAGQQLLNILQRLKTRMSQT